MVYVNNRGLFYIKDVREIDGFGNYYVKLSKLDLELKKFIYFFYI